MIMVLPHHRETPLLFQVEHDLGERINVAATYSEKVRQMMADLERFEVQLKKEGTFWDTEN